MLRAEFSYLNLSKLRRKHNGTSTTLKFIYDRINSIHKFDAILNYDLVTKKFKLIIEGTLKGKTMQKSGLTEADWKRIATMLENTVKPIKDDIQILKEDVKTLKADMKNVKVDVKNLKTDMKDVKGNIAEINHRLDRIQNCPTIKKELK